MEKNKNLYQLGDLATIAGINTKVRNIYEPKAPNRPYNALGTIGTNVFVKVVWWDKTLIPEDGATYKVVEGRLASEPAYNPENLPERRGKWDTVLHVSKAQLVADAAATETYEMQHRAQKAAAKQQTAQPVQQTAPPVNQEAPVESPFDFADLDGDMPF